MATNPLVGTDPDSAYLHYQSVEGGGTATLGSGSVVQVGVGLFDLNGDLLPDRVMSGFAAYNTNAMTNLYRAIQHGKRLHAQMRSYPYRSQNMTTHSGISATAESLFASFETADSHFLDLNGDGLPDHLMWPANANGLNGEASHPVSYYALEYNNGYSFESTNNNLTTVPGAADVWPGVMAQNASGGFNYNGNPYYTDAMIEQPFAGLWDLNGDGLPDRVVVDQTNFTTATPRWFVYLNNGHGFNTNPVVISNIDNQGHYLISDLAWWSPQGPIWCQRHHAP